MKHESIITIIDVLDFINHWTFTLSSSRSGVESVPIRGNDRVGERATVTAALRRGRDFVNLSERSVVCRWLIFFGSGGSNVVSVSWREHD